MKQKRKQKNKGPLPWVRWCFSGTQCLLIYMVNIFSNISEYGWGWFEELSRSIRVSFGLTLEHVTVQDMLNSPFHIISYHTIPYHINHMDNAYFFNSSPHFLVFGSFRIRLVVYSSRHSSYSNCHPLNVVFCYSYYVLGSSSATSLSENVENLPPFSPSVPKQLS